jgi:hypothetical protein
MQKLHLSRFLPEIPGAGVKNKFAIKIDGYLRRGGKFINAEGLGLLQQCLK